MVKPEWGTKRTCPKCATRFYDLGKDDPIHCINCGVAWQAEPVLKSKQPLPFEQAKPEIEAEKEDADLADELVADVEPRLKEINGGKDAAITWRHLASQTSGYGLVERPGEAYSYNDYALALYYDSLTRGVFKEEGTALLKKYFAGPLGFEDACTFEAFGAEDRPGRLAVSVRDFARFGLMYLRGGRWGERQIVRKELIRQAERKNVSGATLAYTQLVSSCVQCHTVVRDAKK